jgi:hypothetical protein
MDDGDGFYILTGSAAGTGSFFLVIAFGMNMVKTAANIERASSSRRDVHERKKRRKPRKRRLRLFALRARGNPGYPHAVP